MAYWEDSEFVEIGSYEDGIAFRKDYDLREDESIMEEE